MFSLLVVVVFCTFGTNGVVHKDTNGEAWYCNSNPLNLHGISALPANDINRINKLEQVQVMTRHGSRTHMFNIQRYFPNHDEYYHCNISTVTANMNIESNGASYSIPMLKTFEYDNQILYHSNCQHMQSMPTLIHQQTQNAQIIINAYMSSNNASQLFDLYQLNQQSIASKYMKFYTSNWERCLLSTMAITSHLLNLSSSNTTTIQPMLETITNDQEFNPYAPQNNFVCSSNTQFQSWSDKSAQDIYNNYIKPKQNEIVLSIKDVINQYLHEGGKWYPDDMPYAFEHAGFQMVGFYCNGFDIPLSNDTFWKLINNGYEWISVQADRFSDNLYEIEYAEKQQCVDHFMSIPMYKRFRDEIDDLINGDSEYKKRFILHSAHDTSLSLFLSGLGLYDGVFPYFAQLMTLEIYSTDPEWRYDNDRRDTLYLFRFTNKGKFVPYQYCMDEYIDYESELCDLNILLNNGFKDATISQMEWAKHRCSTLLDDCVCGYCHSETHEIPIIDDTNTIQFNLTDNITLNESQINNQQIIHNDFLWSFELISFIIGICIGCILTVIFMFSIKYFIFSCKNCCEKRKLQKQYQSALDDSDVEIVEVNINEQLMTIPDKNSKQ